MEFILGGVVYEQVTTHTLLRRAWLDRYGRKAGLLDLGSLPAPTDEASVGRLISRIVGLASEARVTVELLAGGLTRKGEKWSERQAEENIPILGEVEEEAALEAIGLIIWDFIRSEPALLRNMLLYSLPPGMTGTEASLLTPNPASVPSSPNTMASGTASPGPSPATTQTDMQASASGS